MPDRPTPGGVEERALSTLSAEGKRIRGVIPYGVESRDLGGFREVIEPGALNGARLDDLVATVDHKGLPLGRYPGTLQVEERSDGLHWSVEPPASRADVREAIERGDLRAGSWRMVVGRDEWRGDVRHIHEIRELRDVAVATSPAYPSAVVELRSVDNDNGGERRQKEGNMPDETSTGAAVEERTDTNEEKEEQVEDRSAEQVEDRVERPERLGRLRVEDRSTAPVGLAAAFRSRGFPEERATMSWGEFEEARTASFDGETVDPLNPVRHQGIPLGADTRYAYPAFPTVAVESNVTSVDVLRQKSRTLPSVEDVIRDIDAVTEKPEVASELELVQVPMKQVAGVQSGIPNVILAQDAVGPIIERDLRLAIDEALDALVLDALAEAAELKPEGAPPKLVQIRQAMTLVQGAGYAPDTVILSPVDAEEIDVLRVDPETEDYVFGAAQLAPRRLFGSLEVRIAKGATAPIVVDSAAFGRLHASPITLATFEENAGSTNTSLVRLEGHAAFGTERVTAAVRLPEGGSGSGS